MDSDEGRVAGVALEHKDHLESTRLVNHYSAKSDTVYLTLDMSRIYAPHFSWDTLDKITCIQFSFCWDHISVIKQ